MRSIRASAPLVTLAVTAPTATAQVYDFSASPPGTYENVEVVDGHLRLAKDTSGNFVEEGWFEVEDAAALFSQRMIRVAGQAVSSIVEGTLEDASGAESTIYFYHPNKISHGKFQHKTTGLWFTSDNGSRPSIDSDGSGGYVATIDQRADLEQFFAVAPGESYRLRFTLDPTGLYTATGDAGDPEDDQAFSAVLHFFDEDFRKLHFRDPKNGEIVDQLVLQRFTAPDGSQDVSLRLRVMDCDDHLQFVSSDGTTEVQFNFCSGGDDSTYLSEFLYDGTSDEEYEYRDLTAADVAHASVRFATEWLGSDYHDHAALLADVEVHREDQIEVQLLDDDGTLLQRSSLLGGFLSEDLVAASDESDKVLRLVLRSHLGDASPFVARMRVFRAARARVDLSTVVLDVGVPRLGFAGHPPPRIEWYQHDLAYRTEAIDPFDGTTVPLLDLLVENGVTRWRNSLQVGSFEVSWDDTADPGDEYAGLSMPLSARDDVDDHLDMDGESWVRRYGELAESGFEILGLVEPNGFVDWDEDLDEIVWRSKWRAEGFGTTDDTNGDGEPDGIVESHELDWVLALHQGYARRQVELLSGTSSEPTTDGDFTPPYVPHWEVLNEHNNNADRRWHRRLFPDPADHVAALNGMAGTVRDYATDPLTVQTSLAGNGYCFDVEYVEQYWTDTFEPSPEDYTHLGVHCYERGCATEERRLHLAGLRDALTADWKTKSMTVGEYGIQRGEYWPDCEDEWDRELGGAAFGKMVARATLTLLSLPTEQLYYYAPFAGAWRGGTLAYDPCWRAEKMFNLFERVPGPGWLGDEDESTLDGDPAEASLYEVNEGGRAFLGIARELSVSSPVLSNSWTPPEAEVELHCEAFLNGEGELVLALWFFRDDVYSHVQTNFLSGVADTGFVERRRYDVRVTGLHARGPATVIYLDGRPEGTVPVAHLGPGDLRVLALELGEMPVLVRLRLAPGARNTEAER